MASPAKEWHRFTDRQKVEQQLPGIQGIGFAQLIPDSQLVQHLQEIRAEGFPQYRVWPDGQRDIYSSIIYLEPFADRNLRAFGYDMLSEPVRCEAMERARDQDAAALSGKVVLVQESDKDVQAGTLMYVPVYRLGMPYETVAQRRAAILGWVYSPYRMNDLMQGVLGGSDVEGNHLIHLEIFDGDKASPETLLYDSQSAGGNERVPASAFTLQTPVDSAGRRWTLCFTQSGNLAAAVDYGKVWLVLLGGTSISLLLFGLSLSLLNTRFSARQIAEKLTADNKTLEEFNHVAESATRAKSEFLANMSHEIRTPMTAILGYADLLLDEEGIENGSPSTGDRIVETIKRNGEHLLGLINDILDLSKVEAGKMQIEPVRCSPCELVADVVSLMRVRATAKHLKLESDLTPPLPETILTDPLRLRQVLVNLVGNAIKFTDQGEVRIAVRLTEDSGQPRLRFDVTDTGIGMDEEQIGRLFQAFSQVDNSSERKFGGTGLGLCISKRITEAMGGKIEVHSTPGKGSTFSVTIDPGPLDGIRMIENTHEALLGCPPVVATEIPSKIELHGRVLLAEDGPDNQRLIAFLLKKAGAEVKVAENGQIAYDEALAAITQGTPFGVILMDMQMPVMDGYTATQQLREQGYTGPIVALTANAMAEDCQKCLDAGCDDYATKPIDRQKLLATVAHWMTHTNDDSSKSPATTSNASV